MIESEQVGELVRIYLRKNTWWATLQKSRRQVRRSLRTKNVKVARRRAIELEQELCDAAGGENRRKRVEPALVTVAVSTLIQHLEAECKAKGTLTKYRGVYRTFVEFASRENVFDLGGITPDLLDRYRLFRRQTPCEPKTIYNETVLIRQLVNFALARGLVHPDPLRGLKIQEPKPTVQPCWSPEQVEQILALAPEHYRGLLTLLADTGLRVGEAKWLTWDDVTPQVLHVRPKDGWTTKTGNVRTVPLTDRLQERLRRLPHKARWVFTAPPSSRYPDGTNQVSERRLLQALKRVLKRLHLQGHVHTFRHAYISAALLAGTPEAIVRQWVGHVDAEILRLYTHVADRQSREAMRQFGQILNR